MGLAAEAAPTATKRGKVHFPRSDFGRTRGPTCIDRCMNVSIRWRNRPLPPMHVLPSAQGARRRYRVVPRAPLIRPSATFSPLCGEKAWIPGSRVRPTKKPKRALRLFRIALDHRVVGGGLSNRASKPLIFKLSARTVTGSCPQSCPQTMPACLQNPCSVSGPIACHAPRCARLAYPLARLCAALPFGDRPASFPGTGTTGGVGSDSIGAVKQPTRRIPCTLRSAPIPAGTCRPLPSGGAYLHAQWSSWIGM